ncbi:MAG: 3-dehydroquinate synthase [Actinobacteria bacterium]|jgi:3-dehydroquinate synthase|uniref:3-dehydroquinate synthase n=1 Tax=freshwater metagenome TaxID=449393 RepID=A0A6J6UZM6_9ZZZZ|nr:3-dehydroquinate synthase [Actinomycetota bacterium]MSY11068.1 3-dehydroquinate synthase [Actinomycetota bacterium]
MKIIDVVAERNYSVVVGANGPDEIKSISAEHRKVLLVAPTALIKLFKLKESKNLSIISTPAGENQKSIKVLESVWRKCAAVGIERSDAIIGFGGGATTDLAGFAAATWLRGIDWYAMPTSLAGMVDASIGGKTGLNSQSGKNLIGSFYSPKSVLIDTSYLTKLPARDLSAGMAEVIKCGFISDYKILNLVQDDVIDFDQLIYRAVKVKAKVVAKDFKESKLREILNYGHTLGHAIEKDSKFRLRHGEAVSIGMVFAAELSNELVGLSKEVVDLHRVLSSNFKLPISYPKSRWKSLSALLLKDKKVKQGKVRFIGISKIGKPVWLEDVPSNTLARVYERITK